MLINDNLNDNALLSEAVDALETADTMYQQSSLKCIAAVQFVEFRRYFQEGDF